MYEQACEARPNRPSTCDTDNYSFKAYLSRWMAATTKLAPYTYDIIMPKLKASASAAAQQCSGGDNGKMCGMQWTEGAKWDGTTGVGQQMGALSVIQANLITKAAAPVSSKTGGTSKGDASAGTGVTNEANNGQPLMTITKKDKAGAGILTTLVLIGVIGGCWWMVS